MSRLVQALVRRSENLQNTSSVEYLAGVLDQFYRSQCDDYVANDSGDAPDTTPSPYDLNGAELPDGFERIGSGHFSVVYSHRDCPDYVFKISCRRGDAYLEYAAWCVAQFNSGNASKYNIPKIPFIMLSRGYARIIPVEKLIPIHVGEYGEIIRDDDRKYVEHLGNYSGDLCHNKLHDEGTARYTYVDAMSRYTLQALHKSFKGLSGFDLHSGNVMIHPVTGQYIITDPIGFTTGIRKAKRRNTHGTRK